jgi:hypothetical protein
LITVATPLGPGYGQQSSRRREICFDLIHKSCSSWVGSPSAEGAFAVLKAYQAVRPRPEHGQRIVLPAMGQSTSAARQVGPDVIVHSRPEAEERDRVLAAATYLYCPRGRRRSNWQYWKSSPMACLWLQRRRVASRMRSRARDRPARPGRRSSRTQSYVLALDAACDLRWDPQRGRRRSSWALPITPSGHCGFTALSACSKP